MSYYQNGRDARWAGHERKTMSSFLRDDHCLEFARGWNAMDRELHKALTIKADRVEEFIRCGDTIYRAERKAYYEWLNEDIQASKKQQANTRG